MPESTPLQLQMGTTTLPELFLAALRCPLSGQRLQEVPAGTLGALGFGGVRVEGWSGALLTEDRQAVYPVRGGIPVLLGEERITFGSAGGSLATVAGGLLR